MPTLGIPQSIKVIIPWDCFQLQKNEAGAGRVLAEILNIMIWWQYTLEFLLFTVNCIILFSSYHDMPKNLG